MLSFSDGLCDDFEGITPIHQDYATDIIAYTRSYVEGLRNGQDRIPLWAQAICYVINYPERVEQNPVLSKWDNHTNFKNYAANIIMLINACPSLDFYTRDDKDARLVKQAFNLSLFTHPLASFFGAILDYNFLRYKLEVKEIITAMIAKIPKDTDIASILIKCGSEYWKGADLPTDHVTEVWQILVEIIAPHSQRNITLNHFEFAKHAGLMGYPNTAQNIARECKFSQRQLLTIAKVVDGSDYESKAKDTFIENIIASHEALEKEVAILKQQLAEAAVDRSKKVNSPDEELKPAASGSSHFKRS